ncbi:L-sorbose 1-dehydrogenase [Procambarus clarkii]|uniref:L-sorbose 1-dehydrogenase n=1 Tax=Procambarus clarkii TaxID=6728 RepID=UPI003743E012
MVEQQQQPRQQQQQPQQQQQQPQQQQSSWNLSRIGILAGVIGVAAWAWQAWFGVSEGVVHKADPVYDFIVVGGGTAGCVLAARLSEEENFKVLLVEAGGEEPWISNIPLAAPLLQQSRFDWQYLTEPQEESSFGLFNQQSAWPRGRGLGGTATLNFNIHMFGSPQDFQKWEEEYGATGWGFQEMKKYANKAECRRLRPKIFKQKQCSNEHVEKVDKGCNSSEGEKTGHLRHQQDAVQCYHPPLRVHTAASTLTHTFLAAGKELGLPVGSLNDDIDYGLMAGETLVFKGRRWSNVKGYLRAALGRPNLHVLIHSHVTKILWEGERAVGVEVVQWGSPRLKRTVYARGEVILAAGAINSPSLLMLSGVGPKTVLEEFNIPAVSILEGVGENLQDHLNTPLYVSLEKDVSLNLAKLRTLSNIWDYFVNGGKGDLGRAAVEGVGIMRLARQQPELGVILFNMGALDKHLYSAITNMKLNYFETAFPKMDNHSASGFLFLSTCLHPKSRGQVRIVSRDPLHPPSIQPNYLHHPYDITCMRDAFKFTVRLVRTKAFQNLGASVALPRYQECLGSEGPEPLVRKRSGPEGSGREEYTRTLYQEFVSCIIRVGAISGYHALGTARIGQPGDPMAVVDPELRVIGTEHLRVVDASVMPTQISGAPNSAITVIAEKASDLIKATWNNKSKLASQKICSSAPDCEEKLLSNISNLAEPVGGLISTVIVYILWGVLLYANTGI